jgi:carbon storage regulator
MRYKNASYKGVGMLILTRKPGESLYVGDNVKITLMEIKGNQVRIGVDAPSTVRIYREEIYLQILEENKSAEELSRATQVDLEDVAKAWRGQKPRALSNLDKKGKKE